MRSEKILRPGITSLERLIAEARQRAQAETMQRLSPFLSESCKSLLDGLLIPGYSRDDSSRVITPLAWLRQSASANSPRAILNNLEKISFLEKLGVSRWKLEPLLNPNRLKRLAQIASLNRDRLIWCNNWYIREETLKAANSALVNFHYHQPLTQHWGGGTLSSSDGQRFPVSGKVRIAEALPRYFGYGKGVVFYTWTSDQYSQYGTKVIPATVRDATYVLDEILDNETELSIIEHTTDTSGYTEIVFALFDLLGMQFAPRIRDISDQHLYRPDLTRRYPNLESQLKSRIKWELIEKHWDDLLRVAGSLKMGWVTASLFISKMLNASVL